MPGHPIFEIGSTSGAATTPLETTSIRLGTSQTRSTEEGESVVNIQAAVVAAPATRTTFTDLVSETEKSIRHVGIDGTDLITDNADHGNLRDKEPRFCSMSGVEL